jgi:aerobic carbon-monoxide dehydrogenase large subunit
MSVGAGRFVGQSVTRREDPRLLTGRGRYVDDVAVPGALHASFVRSPVARGRIAQLDVDAARALPGVHAVLTAADLNPHAGTMQPTLYVIGPQSQGPQAPLRPLADGDVRFVGDPIALVVADSRYVAEDACDLVEVDFDPMPPLVDLHAALAAVDDPVHPELGSNVALELATPPDSELDEILASAPHVVTETFVQQRQTNVPMETRGIVAVFEPASGELRIWMSTQNPHEVRLAASRVTGVPEHHVRVSAQDVGGGFGQKYWTPREELTVALAATRLGRAIKWIEDRRENLIASNHARADEATLTMALDDDGRILAMTLDHMEDVGAYPVGGTGAMGAFLAMLVPGPYRVPKVGWRTRAVWTNTCGRGAYRGPWMFETVAREQMLDHVARTVGLDPAELRRRNVVRAGDLPHTTATGLTYDVVTPEETLDQATEIVDYDDFRASQPAARAEGRLLGVGIGLYVEPSSAGVGPLGVEPAVVRVEPGGTVTVLLGTGSHGQSVETTIAQVVAEHLGVHLDAVTIVQGDTGEAPYGPGTGGSRTAVMVGGAAAQAADEVRAKVVELAAHLMEAAPDDLEVGGGVVSVRGTPALSVTLADVARVAYLTPDELPPGMAPGLESSVRFTSPNPFTWSNACHVCTVEIDRDTGLVAVLRYVVSEDCGVMINPMVVEGQIAGGVAQGLGGVFTEHFVYDEDGNPLTTTFLDYTLPSTAEMPLLEYGHVETRSPMPGGHKGMGEGGAIGSPPALFNAVADALAPLGVHPTRTPLGPSEILALVEAGS